MVVYLPIFALTGVEGKMFHPMAMTVIIALLSEFLLSLTFFPAMIALFVSGHGEEGENALVRSLKHIYQPVLTWAMEKPRKVMAIGVGSFALAALIYSSLGQEFIPTLDEKNIAMQANRIPSASLTQSQAMHDIAYAVHKCGRRLACRNLVADALGICWLQALVQIRNQCSQSQTHGRGSQKIDPWNQRHRELPSPSGRRWPKAG